MDTLTAYCDWFRKSLVKVPVIDGRQDFLPSWALLPSVGDGTKKASTTESRKNDSNSLRVQLDDAINEEQGDCVTIDLASDGSYLKPSHTSKVNQVKQQDGKRNGGACESGGVDVNQASLCPNGGAIKNLLVTTPQSEFRSTNSNAINDENRDSGMSKFELEIDNTKQFSSVLTEGPDDGPSTCSDRSRQVPSAHIAENMNSLKSSAKTSEYSPFISDEQNDPELLDSDKMIDELLEAARTNPVTLEDFSGDENLKLFNSLLKMNPITSDDAGLNEKSLKPSLNLSTFPVRSDQNYDKYANVTNSNDCQATLKIENKIDKKSNESMVSFHRQGLTDFNLISKNLSGSSLSVNSDYHWGNNRNLRCKKIIGTLKNDQKPIVHVVKSSDLKANEDKFVSCRTPHENTILTKSSSRTSTKNPEVKKFVQAPKNETILSVSEHDERQIILTAESIKAGKVNFTLKEDHVPVNLKRHFIENGESAKLESIPKKRFLLDIRDTSKASSKGLHSFTNSEDIKTKKNKETTIIVKKTGKILKIPLKSVTLNHTSKKIVPSNVVLKIPRERLKEQKSQVNSDNQSSHRYNFVEKKVLHTLSSSQPNCPENIKNVHEIVRNPSDATPKCVTSSFQTNQSTVADDFVTELETKSNKNIEQSTHSCFSELIAPSTDFVGIENRIGPLEPTCPPKVENFTEQLSKSDYMERKDSSLTSSINSWKDSNENGKKVLKQYSLNNRLNTFKQLLKTSHPIENNITTQTVAGDAKEILNNDTDDRDRIFNSTNPSPDFNENVNHGGLPQNMMMRTLQALGIKFVLAQDIGMLPNRKMIYPSRKFSRIGVTK